MVIALCPKHSLASYPIEFNRDILPILSDACFACHGPDKHARQADLRLDDRDNAIATGAISPGKIDASSILERIV
ncbi:MAG: c-type cytochrome domain-containing protein, partial [Pirellula sp.]